MYRSVRFAGEIVAKELSRKGMYLPSSSGLKEEEIRYICEEIGEIKELVKGKLIIYLYLNSWNTIVYGRR